MGTKRDKSCKECDGNGWVMDILGGCGDPECCGGPWKVQCHSCDNDWEPDDDDDEPANVEVTGAAQTHRAASRERSERGRP